MSSREARRGPGGSEWWAVGRLVRGGSEVLSRCARLIHEGSIAEADAMVGASIEREPDNGTLWQARGLIRQRLGDHDGACEALETAAALVPLEPGARCALADCYRRMGKLGLAIELYRLLADDPGCPTDMLPAVASGLGAAGEYEAALEVCGTLTRRDPACHEAHFGQAYYLRRLGHPIEVVVAQVMRAHELAPGVILYRVALASLLAHLGHIDDAHELLRDVAPETVGCRCCLRRMMNIFRVSGDEPRRRACQRRAAE